MDEKQYVDEAWLNEKELGEKDVEKEYTGKNGQVSTACFRIRQIDGVTHDDIQCEAMVGVNLEDNRSLKEHANDADIEIVCAGTVKPQLDRGRVRKLKMNKEAGLFNWLLEEIKTFSGISPMQVMNSKKSASPEPPSVQD